MFPFIWLFRFQPFHATSLNNRKLNENIPQECCQISISLFLQALKLLDVTLVKVLIWQILCYFWLLWKSLTFFEVAWAWQPKTKPLDQSSDSLIHTVSALFSFNKDYHSVRSVVSLFWIDYCFVTNMYPIKLNILMLFSWILKQF